MQSLLLKIFGANYVLVSHVALILPVYNTTLCASYQIGMKCPTGGQGTINLGIHKAVTAAH